MVGIASLISVPIGVGAGIFFSEWGNSKLSTVSGFMNDVLTGFPSMVLGLFVFIIIVLTYKEFSAFAGGVALSFVMLPIIARTTDESLKLVPTTLREASMALGIPRWKTVLRVVISTGKNGLLTGILLAVARATGETAPILLTAATSIYFAKSLFQPTASLTVLIYNYGTSPYPTWIAQAWGAALVLILIMLGIESFGQAYYRKKSCRRSPPSSGKRAPGRCSMRGCARRRTAAARRRGRGATRARDARTVRTRGRRARKREEELRRAQEANFRRQSEEEARRRLAGGEPPRAPARPPAAPSLCPRPRTLRARRRARRRPAPGDRRPPASQRPAVRSAAKGDLAHAAPDARAASSETAAA